MSSDYLHELANIRVEDSFLFILYIAKRFVRLFSPHGVCGLSQPAPAPQSSVPPVAEVRPSNTNYNQSIHELCRETLWSVQTLSTWALARSRHRVNPSRSPKSYEIRPQALRVGHESGNNYLRGLTADTKSSGSPIITHPEYTPVSPSAAHNLPNTAPQPMG